MSEWVGGRERGGREGGEGGRSHTCVFRDVLSGRVESLLPNDAAGGFDLRKGTREDGEKIVSDERDKKRSISSPIAPPSLLPSLPPSLPTYPLEQLRVDCS